MIDTNALLEMKSKYLVRLPYDFRLPKERTKRLDPIYIQNASNCWMFSTMQDAYFMTGLVTDQDKFSKLVAETGKDVSTGGQGLLAEILLCEFWKEKDLVVNEINLIYKHRIGKAVYTDDDFDTRAIKLWTRLLLQGTVFLYSRISGNQWKADVRDNDEIDAILEKEDGAAWHRSEYFFNKDIKKLQEISTWSEKSKYNQFTFGSTDRYIKSVKNKTIDPTIRFIYFRQK